MKRIPRRTFTAEFKAEAIYGADGKPELDIDKPHQGYEKPHVHEWPDGKREEPGRDVSPVEFPKTNADKNG